MIDFLIDITWEVQNPMVLILDITGCELLIITLLELQNLSFMTAVALSNAAEVKI